MPQAGTVSHGFQTKCRGEDCGLLHPPSLLGPQGLRLAKSLKGTETGWFSLRSYSSEARIETGESGRCKDLGAPSPGPRHWPRLTRCCLTRPAWTLADFTRAHSRGTFSHRATHACLLPWALDLCKN